MKKINKPKQTTAQLREMKLLSELCNKHGYVMREIRKPADRAALMLDQAKAKWITMRVIQLAVPSTSALAIALGPVQTNKKAKR
jgi:hypothetical protein